jgi:predicted O-methyltransferase YrrM
MTINKLLKYIKSKIYFFRFRIIRYLRNFLEIESLKQWNNFPLGSNLKAEKDRYIQLAIDAKKEKYPEIELYEHKSGFQIDKQWLNNLALHTQVVIKKSKICYAHGKVLYSSLSKYVNEHQNIININILETGTARGFSSLCMAKALEDNNKEGTIMTFDVLPHNSKMFWNCIDDHDGPKTRRELLSSWSSLLERYIVFCQGDTRIEMKKTKFERIHFAFLDGFHTYNDIYFEYNEVKGYQKTGDIIIFDDYTPKMYPGLVKAVDEICQTDDYLKIVIKSSNNRGYVIAEKK